MNTENTAPRSTGNSRIIARNTVWSGVEVLSGMLATFLTSVWVARVLGKDAASQATLGSYQYIVWLTTITLTVGSFGLSTTTWKYMAEYLNNGHPEIARAIYFYTLRIQSLISFAAGAAGFAAIWWLGDERFLWASALLVAAIVPRLIGTIPSCANNAAEAVRRNATPAVVGVAITVGVTAVSLLLRWDYVGLSAAVFLGAAVECGLKMLSVERWLGGTAPGGMTPELRKRMLTYSGQGVALMLLNLLVWDRSDILILKALNPDTRQIVFFSISFSLAERILMVPTLFAGALGFTMMAQYGRGEARLKEMTADGGRYALLLALPLLAGVACISRPFVVLLYTPAFQPMVATMAIVALLAIPKALVAAPTRLLQTTERQGFLIWWGCVCGALDIGLDVLLVGRHGANGAAIANGAAQAMAALGVWIYAWRADALDLKLKDCARVLGAGAIMALGALAAVRVAPGAAGLVAAIAAGAVLWLVGLRVTRAVRPEDAARFLSIGAQLPAGVRPYWSGLIAWLAPAAAPVPGPVLSRSDS